MSNTLLEIIAHQGTNIKVWYDDRSNPRKDCDNLGTMVCWHPKYILGDEQPKRSPEEWLREYLSSQYHQRMSLRRKHTSQGQYDYDCNLEEMCMAELTVEFMKHNLSMPLYLLDHSGLTIKAGSKGASWEHWDTSTVGWIYVSHDRILQEYGGKRITKEMIEKATGALDGETQTYATYLQQEIYAYTVEDTDGDVLDSCMGFYGDEGKEEMIDQARAFIDKPKCDQCRMSYVKVGKVGMNIHEKGCPNDDKVWHPEDQSWHEVESENIDDEMEDF